MGEQLFSARMPKAMLILFVKVCWITESLHFKNPKVKEKKSSALSFFTCVFFPASDLCRQ
jgi:hypothetical protein